MAHPKGSPELRALQKAGTTSQAQSKKHKGSLASKRDIRALQRKAKEKFADAPEKALEFFVQVMQDDEADLKVRMSAAIEVMDRVWGKPTQTINDGRDGGSIAQNVEHQYIQLVQQIADKPVGRQEQSPALPREPVAVQQDRHHDTEGSEGEPEVQDRPAEGG